MFVTSAEYKKVVTSIAEEEGELLVAVAFWGKGAESIVDSRSGGPVKIICNLTSGATNPTIIEALRNKENICLKQHDRLHAKVVVGSRRAVVGSANFSSNGLNLEGEESNGWVEAGFVIECSTQIGIIKTWFEKIWNNAHDIDSRNIKIARAIWEKRRASRIIRNTVPSRRFLLGSFTHADLLERRVYVVMHNLHDEELSQEAQEAAKNKGSAPEDCYEDFPELPRDAQFIDIRRRPRGELTYIGVYTWIHEQKFQKYIGVYTWIREQKFRNESVAEGHLTVCRKENQIMGLRFGRTEGDLFVRRLRPHIETIWDSALACGGNYGRYISLAEVVDICS